MPSARALPAQAEATPIRLPFRLRHVLGSLLLVLIAWQGIPRAKAAWRLQSMATSFADYGLCMAGPTGPTLLRDNAGEFWRVVRRRLLTSPPDSRPFQGCAALAEEITGHVEVRRAHGARAREFVEYGADASDRAQRGRHGELTLAALEVSTQPLAELSRAARPFLRQGYTVLVQPSISAPEAQHPSELPQAAVGEGLPASRVVYRASQALDEQNLLLALGSGNKLSAYKSGNGGVSWQPLSVNDARIEAIGGRCFGEDPAHSFAIGLDGANHQLRVVSLARGARQGHAALPRGYTQVISVACDESALVVAAGRVGEAVNAEVSLFLCPYMTQCRPMPVPEWGQGLSLRQPLDLARTQGATVLAMTHHGIVRTASSRDDGRSWTPFIVAFDRGEQTNLRVQVDDPTQLLAVGKRVLLYGGAPKPGMTYPVLISDDQGASWRNPLPN